MANTIEYFECTCSTPEHTLRFSIDDYDDGPELYTAVFLFQPIGIFHRLWVAFKYVFGLRCNSGHFDCTILTVHDAQRLIDLLQGYKRLYYKRSRKNEHYDNTANVDD